MRILPPRLVENGDRSRLQAEFELDDATPDLPKAVHFEVEHRDAEAFLSPRMEPFVVALLPIAMALGEDVHVEGPLSPRLADGLRSWQQATTLWWPEQFQRVAVKYESLAASDASPATGVGCFFSGGVDSFFSVWQHLPDQENLPTCRVTHAIMIHGFDQDRDPSSFEKLRAIYEPRLRELGVSTLAVHSNLSALRRAFLSQSQLAHSYGTVLAGCAHALVGGFGRALLSGFASTRYRDLLPNGSHPILDHHLGCEQLQVVHDGSQATRCDKIGALVGLPQTRDSLRVCEGPPRFDPRTGGIVNCCRCVKCRRTMVPLELYGVLEEYSTFPEPLRARHVRRLFASHGEGSMYLADSLALARRLGRRDRVRDLKIAIAWNRLAAPIRRLRGD